MIRRDDVRTHFCVTQIMNSRSAIKYGILLVLSFQLMPILKSMTHYVKHFCFKYSPIMALDFMVCHKIQVQNAECFIQTQLHAVFNDATDAKSENV